MQSLCCSEKLTPASKATFYYMVAYLRGVVRVHPSLKNTICGMFSQLWIETPASASGVLSAYLGPTQSPYDQCAGFIDMFLITEHLAPSNRLSVDDPDVALPRVLP